MLLSADWFLPYQHELALSIDRDAAISLQEQCRAEVKTMLGSTKRYDRISLSSVRVSRTRDALLRAFELFAPNSLFAKASILMIAAGRKYPPQDFFAFQLSHLNHRLVERAYDEIGDVLGSDLKRKLLDILGLTLQPPKDYGAAGTASQTRWDRFLRSLTPAQPTLLSDVLTSKVVPHLELLRFRQMASSRLSTLEAEALQRWYEREAADLGMPLSTNWLSDEEF